LKSRFLKLLILFCLFWTQFSNAQFFKENFYYEGEVGFIAGFFVTNQNEKTEVFSISGLSFRGGVGVHNNEGSLFIGINSGIEGNFRRDTGILPVYLNSKFFIDLTDKTKLLLSFGYGRSFQIGTENYSGYLRKYTIGITKETEKDNYFGVFFEINNHGFYFPDGFKAVTLNVGINYTFL
jgi:hypothetical protein